MLPCGVKTFSLDDHLRRLRFMETLNNIISTLASAPPEALVAIVSLGAMFFMFMIIKAFFSLLEKKWN